MTLDANSVNIDALPSLPLGHRADLPDRPAVYFAIAANGEVLYIGRAISLLNRWKSHHRKHQLEEFGNVQIAWLVTDNPETLVALEAQLVGRFEPQLNASAVDGGPNATVSCHVRFPIPLYEWLVGKAQPEFKSPQKKVIELVLAAQEAESRQEQAA